MRDGAAHRHPTADALELMVAAGRRLPAVQRVERLQLPLVCKVLRRDCRCLFTMLLLVDVHHRLQSRIGIHGLSERQWSHTRSTVRHLDEKPADRRAR
jgi:hypothetical protein